MTLLLSLQFVAIFLVACSSTTPKTQNVKQKPSVQEQKEVEVKKRQKLFDIKKRGLVQKQQAKKREKQRIISNVTTSFQKKVHALDEQYNPKYKIALQRMASQEVVVDFNKHLMWQDNGATETTKKSWKNAQGYCKKLTMAGFSDWRLPTRLELLSITDKRKYNPTIKKAFKNVSSRYYWSRSSYVISGLAWIVDFKYGNDDYYNKSFEYLVRCVRDSL